jgi:hypothetical protein
MCSDGTGFTCLHLYTEYENMVLYFNVQAQTFGNCFPSREPHTPRESRLFSAPAPHMRTYNAGHWFSFAATDKDDALLDEIPSVIK